MQSLSFGKAFEFSSAKALLSYPAAGGEAICFRCHNLVPVSIANAIVLFAR